MNKIRQNQIVRLFVVAGSLTMIFRYFTIAFFAMDNGTGNILLRFNDFGEGWIEVGILFVLFIFSVISLLDYDFLLTESRMTGND